MVCFALDVLAMLFHYFIVRRHKYDIEILLKGMIYINLSQRVCFAILAPLIGIALYASMD